MSVVRRLQKDDDDNNKSTLQQHPVVFHCFDKVFAVVRVSVLCNMALCSDAGDTSRIQNSVYPSTASAGFLKQIPKRVSHLGRWVGELLYRCV